MTNPPIHCGISGKKAARKTAKKTARTETDSTGKKAVKASGEEKKDD